MFFYIFPTTSAYTKHIEKNGIFLNGFLLTLNTIMATEHQKEIGQTALKMSLLYVAFGTKDMKKEKVKLFQLGFATQSKYVSDVSWLKGREMSQGEF